MGKRTSWSEGKNYWFKQANWRNIECFSAVIPKEYGGQRVDGIHINIPSGLSLPSTGLWRLYVIVGDKYFDSVIIDVQEM
jgi:hypothetical protein